MRRTPRRAGSRHRWLATALMAVVLLAATVLPAHAVLQQMGPVNNAASVGGFPAWFQDTTGITMEFGSLLNAAELSGGWVTLIPPGLSFPETFPTSFFIEHFYHDAVASVTSGATKAKLIVAVEASFANGAVVVPGQQMTFGRIRVFIPSLPFSGTYTVYHPFGVWTFPGMAAGDKLFFTEDVGLGCVGTFTCTLGTSIGPFLLPSPTPGGPEVPPIPDLLPGQDPFYDALVAIGGASVYPGTGKKYIADPKRIGPVTGSPLPPFVGNDGVTYNHNTFRVEGPNGFVMQTDNFTTTGRLMTAGVVSQVNVDRASYTVTATGTKLDVFATATPSTTGRLPGQPPAATLAPALGFYEAACGGALTIDPVTGAITVNPPPYTAPAVPEHPMANTGSNFWGQSTPVALPNPAYVCVQDHTSQNALGQTVPTFLLKALTDDVFITNPLAAGQLPPAYYNGPAGGTLTVKASSSDPLAGLTLQGFGPGGTGLPLVTGTASVTGLAAPPATVQVVSSAGGAALLPVVTSIGAAVIAGVPVAANDTVTMFEDCSATPATACATPQVITPLANDTYNGAPIPAGAIVTITQAPGQGTAVVNPGGTISYVPNPNVNGTDTIGYTVTVNGVSSNQGLITVNITPVPDYPVAVPDVTGALRGVLNRVNVFANDTDPDGIANLTAGRAVIVTGNPALGITAGASFLGGAVTYTPPAATAAGPYTFTYNAVDADGLVSLTPATVTVNLSATEAIIVAKDIYTQAKGRWTVQGTVSPIAGQTLTMTYVDGTYKVNGACTGSAAGTVIGTATADALGTWLLDTILNTTAGVLNPSNTGGNGTGFWCTPPKSLKITSSLTGTSVTSAISLK